MLLKKKSLTSNLRILRQFMGNSWCHTSIFQSTSLQPVNGSKNSILNWVMKLNLFMFFFLFVFKTPLKDFPCYPSIILTLQLRYLQKCKNESCMYVSSQLFFKTPHETLKFQEKFIFLQTAELNLKKFFIQCLTWGHPKEPLN